MRGREDERHEGLDLGWTLVGEEGLTWSSVLHRIARTRRHCSHSDRRPAGHLRGAGTCGCRAAKVFCFLKPIKELRRLALGDSAAWVLLCPLCVPVSVSPRAGVVACEPGIGSCGSATLLAWGRGWKVPGRELCWECTQGAGRRSVCSLRTFPWAQAAVGLRTPYSHPTSWPRVSSRHYVGEGKQSWRASLMFILFLTTTWEMMD